MTEELKCLSLLNALHKDPDIPEQLAQLLGEPCMKLAEGIKAYISKVTGTGGQRGGGDLDLHLECCRFFLGVNGSTGGRRNIWEE